MILFLLVIAFAAGYVLGNDKARSFVTGKTKLKLVPHEKKDEK